MFSNICIHIYVCNNSKISNSLEEQGVEYRRGWRGEREERNNVIIIPKNKRTIKCTFFSELSVNGHDKAIRGNVMQELDILSSCVQVGQEAQLANELAPLSSGEEDMRM